jgi:hypothetical protein
MSHPTLNTAQSAINAQTNLAPFLDGLRSIIALATFTGSRRRQ